MAGNKFIPEDLIRNVLSEVEKVALSPNVKVADKLKAARLLLDKSLPSLAAVQHEHMGVFTINIGDPIQAAKEVLGVDE